MNCFQIHLNDNGFKKFYGNDWSQTPAAFRLESTVFPGLATEGAHYSKKEFVELQMLAEQYGVTVLPEIDVPAHSLAFTRYKPEIASKEYGEDHLDLFNPETYLFLDSLFAEYLGGENPVGVKKCILVQMNTIIRILMLLKSFAFLLIITLNMWRVLGRKRWHGVH